MRIAIYGKTFNPGFIPYIQQVYDILVSNKSEVYFYEPFLKFIRKNSTLSFAETSAFSGIDDFPGGSELLISIGGDGTFLDTIPFALKSDIPVVGLNSGRLGFLANISQEEIIPAFNAIFRKNYHIEFRSLLHIESPENLFGESNFALNEVTVQKQGSSMITVEAYLNNDFLNTYWTDGLIISTPTGSTAYSLSVGGPIITPDAGILTLAPIASHTLSVRPVVVPDNLNIRLKVYSRTNKFIVTADSKAVEVETAMEFTIAKARFKLKMLQVPNNNFYSTIRNKLMWGADVRN